MTPDRLIKHFHEIADAPDAIARLRRFILDLAVRGKLVEQNPEDEPSNVLLDRIAHLRAGESQRGKSRIEEVGHLSPDVATDIPSSWAWSCLVEIGLINPRVEALDDEAASFVPMPLIFAEYRKPPLHQVRAWAEIKKGFTQFAEGDVGLAKITPCFENGKSTVFRNLTGGIGAGTTELHIVRPILVDSDYVLLFLKSPSFLDGGIPSMTGTAGQKRVPRDYFARSPFPLPPLAEQHRIVAKVDELMALCEELEATQTKREHRRDRLVAATLHHLSNGNTATAAGQADSINAKRWPEFQQSAQQASTEHPKNATSSGFPPAPAPSLDEKRPAHLFVNHLPRLTTKPNHIKQLRQTILNLAVQGKLVPQDPNEEPALDLDNCLDESPSKPFAIPAHWKWCRLNRIGLLSGGGTPSKSNESYWGGTIPWVSPKDMKSDRIGHSQLYITKDAVSKSAVRIISAGSLLFVVRGMILSHSFPVGVNEVPVTINQDMKAISPQIPEWSDFLLVALKGLKSEILRKVQRSSHGTCRIESADYANLPVPIPPLAEQHRIVAKVDALMTLCDELEASITTATTTRTALLESTLQAALHAGESR